MSAAQTYLGDAVYAAWDGYHLTLTANPGEDEQTIYLEPDTLENLHRFIAGMAPEMTT